jgi:putative oxidoreductase
MTTHLAAPPRARAHLDLERARRALRAVVPIGRVLLAAIFVLSAPGQFAQDTIRYAAHAGVPFAGVLVPASGILALVGGLSVALGLRARIGAWLLVAFLVPVTLTMHRFWDVPDPAMARLQQVMFMKNLAMLGGALLVTYFGAGPYSFDARTAPRQS